MIVKLMVMLVTFFTLIATPAAAVSNDYPNPNGPKWHCQEYGHFYSWDCIASSGFLYGGMWAFYSAYYEHPNPSTDYVVGEGYFNQNGPNGMTRTSQRMHRIIVINDGAVNALVTPVDWDVSAGTYDPPPPTVCMIVSGENMGQQFPCSALDKSSVIDAWKREAQIPNQDAW